MIGREGARLGRVHVVGEDGVDACGGQSQPRQAAPGGAFSAKAEIPGTAGAGSVTPMQMVEAYAVFANGGYRVQPYFISRIEDVKGNVIMESRPELAGENAERAIDAGRAVVVGVNQFADASASRVAVFRVDPEMERRQIDRLFDDFGFGFSRRRLPSPFGGLGFDLDLPFLGAIVFCFLRRGLYCRPQPSAPASAAAAVNRDL